uniref:Uncharacterized protein n=1 Tax=Zea mays TaxID=4577 RepID=A0A804Q4R3_MAIZE
MAREKVDLRSHLRPDDLLKTDGKSENNQKVVISSASSAAQASKEINSNKVFLPVRQCVCECVGRHHCWAAGPLGLGFPVSLYIVVHLYAIQSTLYLPTWYQIRVSFLTSTAAAGGSPPPSRRLPSLPPGGPTFPPRGGLLPPSLLPPPSSQPHPHPHPVRLQS